MKKMLLLLLLALLAAPIRAQNIAPDVSRIRSGAERGDIVMQFALGKLYEIGGRVINKDEKQAFYWMHKSAQQGNLDACYQLGAYYLEGIGVDVDIEQGVFWIAKSAKSNEIPGIEERAYSTGMAKFLLYLVYVKLDDGDCCAYWADLASKDNTLGEEERREAKRVAAALEAHGFSPVCTTTMGETNLSQNTTTTKSSTKSTSTSTTTPSKTTTSKNSTTTPAKPQLSAAELFAQADNHRYGHNGVAKNPQKAVELYTQAANMGDAEAQLSLGYCYYMGEGVGEDCRKALEWLKKAEGKKHTLSASRQQLLETTLANAESCARSKTTTSTSTTPSSTSRSSSYRNKYSRWPWYYDGIHRGFHVAYIQRAIYGREASSGQTGHYDIFGNEGWSKGLQFGMHFNPRKDKEIIGMNTGFYMEFLFDRWKDAPSDYYDSYAEMNLHVPLEMVLYLPFSYKSALHLRAGLGADFSCFGQLIAWDDSYAPNLDVTYGSDFINRFNLSLNLGVSFHHRDWMFHLTWQKGLLRHPYAPGYRCTLDKLSLGLSFVVDD